jgi:hypothetical protein
MPLSESTLLPKGNKEDGWELPPVTGADSLTVGPGEEQLLSRTPVKIRSSVGPAARRKEKSMVTRK